MFWGLYFQTKYSLWLSVMSFFFFLILFITNHQPFFALMQTKSSNGVLK